MQANTTTIPAPFDEKLLTVKEVGAMIGLKTSSVYKMVSTGELPKPRRLGQRNSRWLLSEIKAYIESLPEAEFKEVAA